MWQVWILLNTVAIFSVSVSMNDKRLKIDNITSKNSKKKFKASSGFFNQYYFKKCGKKSLRPPVDFLLDFCEKMQRIFS